MRFSQLADESGKPEVMVLWADPKKDRSFMRLVAQNRVATVIQKPTGNKKDFGCVGFHPQPFAVFMVFPKPLDLADGTPIIGIKYDLLATSISSRKFIPKVLASARPLPKPPVEKHFSVEIRRELVQKFVFEATGFTRAEAKSQALALAEAEPVPPQAKRKSDKVVKLSEI